MSDLKTKKRIAAEVLGIGQSRVWVDPEQALEVSQAMTRDDVREIIKKGVIQERPAKKQTRARAKRKLELKRKRKGVGQGKRRGREGGRKPSKRKWMERIRSQRRFLRSLKTEKTIPVDIYRRYYMKIKGSDYATIRQLKESMKTDGVLK